MCGRGLFAVLGLAFAAASAAAAPSGETAEWGRAIFHGETALTAHLRGDTRPLPEFALRCANCHTQSSGATAFAPSLSAAYLLEPIPRRGGPPTRYDREAFCKVLATSIDPAAVMLANSMPQYVLSDDECTALWAYFLTR
ncbi:hypothetical protein LMG28614_07234 [Paraburkholderia ultramafica]|uniref:Cytochrome c domain-containing protein n=1 Tax=Paraburkholderia ultramafica TaxID=1544867 RepID=A0A6S7BQS4_9BURK|nr:cytochrome c [Paraburkholderia ultramafica]CAB3810230.1 hypothetical protein LMG28614_07234 [Paraburkholderia ultramafica]